MKYQRKIYATLFSEKNLYIVSGLPTVLHIFIAFEPVKAPHLKLDV